MAARRPGRCTQHVSRLTPCARGAAAAHEHPEVMAIWEPMDKLTEKRNGRPNMEFPHVQPLAVL